MTDTYVPTSQYRFEAALGISAFVSTAVLTIFAFVALGDAVERTQFIVAGFEGVTLALALAIVGHALQSRARRVVATIRREQPVVVAA